MTEKKYPEKIYPKLGLRTDAFGCLTYRTVFNSDFESAYDLGFKNGKLKADLENQAPLVGWSNLTEAIKAGERIDWEALDGLPAKCVHPELGTLTYKLERDNVCSSTMPSGWYMNKSANVWKQAVSDSWYGLQGWSLWVKGDLPLRKLTADQLEPGTCFSALYTKGGYFHAYSRAQTAQVEGGLRVLCFNEHFTHVIARYNAAEVEVVEVYGVGTFQKQEAGE